jgi:hypothetical protein
MAVRGRPPKGVERSNILLRLPTDLIKQVDTFKESLEAERGGFGINRTDMLIRLIEVGLQTLTQARQPVTQPAPASRVNRQGASAPQPTTQPAIPLALEPAPKTAHPVDVPQSAETSTERQNGETDIPPYDTSKYVLGKLCPRGHNYHGTGQSLRHRQRHVCLECDAEGARERRKAKRQEQPA